MKGKPKRPLRGLALLGAASVAVVAAAAVWLQVGWKSLGLQITDTIGDGAQELQGFTLEGAIEWNGTFDSLYFRLEDGVLHTSFWLDKQLPEVHDLGYWPEMVVPKSERAPANGKAFVSQQVNPKTQVIRTYTPALQRTYTYTLPDDTTLRLAGETVTMQEEVPVTAMTGDFSEKDTSYDYTWSGETQNAYDSQYSNWVLSPAADNAVFLGNGYALCWREDLLGRAPGLYRADGLTDEEIRALPRDGQMYGKDVICASTEFGTLTPFYCPADAKTALAGAAMTNGFTLLLYQNSDGVLCADLVTSAGQLSDHRELGALPEGDRYTAICFPRSHTGSVVFGVNCEKLLGQEDYVPTCMELVPLRAENGKITLAHTQCINGDVPNTAVLNETGDAVLTAHTLSNTFSYVTYETGSLGQTVFTTLADHLQLEVYDLNTGRMTYQGRLHTGDLSGWEPESLGRPATLFNFSVQPQEEVAP